MLERRTPVLNVLFVCLGNICRSPMAEGAFRAACEAAAFECRIDSAGTGAYHIGNPPDPRAIKVASENGAHIAGFQARQLQPGDFFEFSHIFALDRANLEGMKAIAPRGGTASIAMLMDAVEGREGVPVKDPYYGDENDFQKAWDEINLAISGLMKNFQERGVSAKF